MTIDAFGIWERLERDRGTERDGMIVLRVLQDSSHEMWLGIDENDGARGLVIEVPIASQRKVLQLPSASGFQARIVRRSDRLTAVVACTSMRHREIFAHIVNDVIEQISRAPDRREDLRVLRERLSLWQSFLRAHMPDGLSVEEQLGLYGELWMLTAYIAQAVGIDCALKSWIGPSGGVQDFRDAGWAIEVKTSAGSTAQVFVGSEEQLSDADVRSLHLCHVALLAATGGLTLPALIARLRKSLLTNDAALAVLERRLFQAGYVDAHEERYADVAYDVRSVDFFRVREGFPRLVRTSLPAGVSAITYRLNLDDCARFRVSDADAIAVVRGTTQ